MNDKVANQLDSYRTRLACLDKPEHEVIWKDEPPVKFTEKVDAARTATAALAAMAGRQSAPVTGSAADKAREEKELENACYTLGRALVACCTDLGDLTMAAKYDMPLSGWRRMRDAALLQRARLLQTDAGGIVAGPGAANAAGYGITALAVSKLSDEADDYEAFVVAPQDAVADRSALTAALPAKSREIAVIFDQIEDLLPQFGGTEAGDEFVAAYLASTRIVDRGHGPSLEPPVVP